MKGNVWTLLYLVGGIVALVWAFTTWFGDHETSRWMVGWLWLGLAIQGFRYALEPWADER